MSSADFFVSYHSLNEQEDRLVKEERLVKVLHARIRQSVQFSSRRRISREDLDDLVNEVFIALLDKANKGEATMSSVEELMTNVGTRWYNSLVRRVCSAARRRQREVTAYDIGAVPKSWRLLGWMVPKRYRDGVYEPSLADLFVEYASVMVRPGVVPCQTKLWFVIRASLITLDTLRAAAVDRLLHGPLDAPSDEDESEMKKHPVLIKMRLANDQC